MRVAPRSLYRRAGEDLEADDMRDLEEYFAHLRNYYGIPASAPVFPTRPRTKSAESSTGGVRARNRRRRATGRNSDAHPWRNTL